MALKSFDNGDSDEARQFLLDRRCERLHPKRHRTVKRKKAVAKKKRNRIAFKVARREKAMARYRAAVRAYWAGEIDAHP